MLLSEVLKEVIALAEAAQAYWSVELPKRHPRYPIVQPGEDSGPPPAEEEKLRQLLAGLPSDVLYQLALIMSLGRRSLKNGGLAERYEAVKDRLGCPEEAVNRMAEKASLAEELSDGLEELQRHHIDVDHLLESVPS
jgi:hypothetical protein